MRNTFATHIEDLDEHIETLKAKLARMREVFDAPKCYPHEWKRASYGMKCKKCGIYGIRSVYSHKKSTKVHIPS